MNLNLCQKEQEQINNWLSLEGNFITYKGNNGFPSFEPLKKGIPEFLLYKGKEVNLSETKIAIVGTRRPDYEALQEAFRFGYECALNNLTVVSGFAEGIDQSAMRGALRGGGKVIGILACGHEIEYPSYTLRLREEILENCGTIVSPFIPFFPSYKSNFPTRNMVIAAYCNITIAVQCPYSSGTLITCDHSIDMGKELFIGSTGIKNTFISEGTNKLFKEGAEAIRTINEIFNKSQWVNVYTCSKNTKNSVRYGDTYYVGIL